MKNKTNIDSQIFDPLPKVGKRFVRRIRKLKKLAAVIAQTELSLALKIAAFALHRQIVIRPRIRLSIILILSLALTFLASSKLAYFLKQKESSIKINGQAVLVADKREEAIPPVSAEMDEQIFSVRSPFEVERPVDHGYISQGYSSYHRGSDIATDYDSPIHPLGPGTVEFAGSLLDGRGNVVIIDHGDGLKSLYAHMNKIYAGVGNKVDKKAVLGTVGLTGRTTGPHVHLEVYDQGVATDPSSVLPQQ